jgi:hypothetical protein
MQLGHHPEESVNDTYVIAQEGTTATLACRTGSIGDSLVSSFVAAGERGECFSVWSVCDLM